MTRDVSPRIRSPKSAAAGETVLIRTLVTHPMESGQRRDAAGAKIPRSIINRFTAELNGRLIIDVALAPAISANPYLEFEAVVDRAGDFVFTWYDDDGSVHTETKPIEIA
jgi:sulfur-oxidizing protein SoxZ